MPAAALNECFECVSVSRRAFRVSCFKRVSLSRVWTPINFTRFKSEILFLLQSFCIHSTLLSLPCLSVISIKRAKLSYDDKCRSSNGNQLLNEKERQREREKSFLPATGYSLPACLPPASHSCRVKLLNYVIKLNTPHLARANEVAFDRTKSFNNCKLLSQHFSTARKASCPLSTIEPYLHATCHMPHA